MSFPVFVLVYNDIMGRHHGIVYHSQTAILSFGEPLESMIPHQAKKLYDNRD